MQDHNYAYINCTVIDGRLQSPPLDNAVILVKNAASENEKSGIITAVGEKEAVTIPENYKVIDLEDKYVLPGLINAHAHLVLSGKASTSAAPGLARLLETWLGKKIALKMMKANVINAVNAGVTTIRGCGDLCYYDLELKKEIDQGQFMGPRLLVAGKLICTTGGHGELFGLVINSKDEARKAVRTNAKAGVDLIKLMGTGGVGDAKRAGVAGQVQMTEEEICAACDEAHRKGLLVASHVQSLLGVKEALRSGVDTLEHGSDMDDEITELCKNNRNSLRGYSALIPTLSAIIEAAKGDGFTRIQRQNALDIREKMINGYRKALKEGIRVGLGTDAGVPGVAHYDVWKEIQYFIEYGNISNQHAIHLGTLQTAEILGIDKETGSIEAGKSADFMVVDKNPLREIAALAKPYMVSIGGHLIDNPRIKPI